MLRVGLIFLILKNIKMLLIFFSTEKNLIVWGLIWYNPIELAGQKTIHTTHKNIVWLKKIQDDIFF